MDKLRKMFDAGERLTAHDVEARLFIDVRNAREYLKLLRAEGYVYVCDHRRDSPHGPPTPVFARRDAEQNDVPRPKAMSSTELRRRVRAKPDRWKAELKRASIARKRKKFLSEGVMVDPLTAAIFRDANMNV